MKNKFLDLYPKLWEPCIGDCVQISEYTQKLEIKSISTFEPKYQLCDITNNLIKFWIYSDTLKSIILTIEKNKFYG